MTFEETHIHSKNINNKRKLYFLFQLSIRTTT